MWEAPRGLDHVNDPVLESLRDVAKRSQEAAAAFADGAMTIRQLTEINSRLGEEKARLESTLVDATPADYDFFVGMPGGVDFRSLDVSRRRLIIDSLFTITVLPVGKGSNKRGTQFAEGVSIKFLGEFAHTYSDLETMLMAARLNPSQVGALVRAIGVSHSETPALAKL
jgi:hypothetical protein